jgi:hypothetical protein
MVAMNTQTKGKPIGGVRCSGSKIIDDWQMPDSP